MCVCMMLMSVCFVCMTCMCWYVCEVHVYMGVFVYLYMCVCGACVYECVCVYLWYTWMMCVYVCYVILHI